MNANRDFSTAVSLLRQATEILSRSSNSTPSHASSSPTNISQSSISGPSVNNLTSGSQAATASCEGTSSRQNTEQAAVNEFCNMASGQGSLNANKDFSTAVSLLRQATEILSRSSNSTPSHASSSPTNISQSSISGPSVNNLTSGSQAATASCEGTSSRQNTEQAAVNEFRNIFAPYSSYARSSFFGCPKPTRPSNRSRRYTPYKPRDTWTHEFVCLCDPNQAVVPNKAQKLELQSAGLGRKKVTFGNKDMAPCK